MRVTELLKNASIDLGAHVDNKAEFRLDDSSVLIHMLLHICKSSEILYMTKLIHLIIADYAYAEMLCKGVDVSLACAHDSNACAWEGDLGGRAEDVDDILIACLLSLIENVEYILRVINKVVDAVGVIPEDTEILSCGLEIRKAADCFVAV